MPNQSYAEWMRDVVSMLRNPAAAERHSDRTMYAYYTQGLASSLVAAQLDRTFEAVQPKLFVASK